MAKDYADTLRKARQCMVITRRALAEALCLGYRRGDTEKWRKDMIEVQATIGAIDDALEDEGKLALREAQAADPSQGREDVDGTTSSAKPIIIGIKDKQPPEHELNREDGRSK